MSAPRRAVRRPARAPSGRSPRRPRRSSPWPPAARRRGGGPATAARRSARSARIPTSRVTKIAGGRHSPPAEAAARRRTKSGSPGPGSRPASRCRPAAFRRPVADYRVYAERAGDGGAAPTSRGCGAALRRRRPRRRQARLARRLRPLPAARRRLRRARRPRRGDRRQPGPAARRRPPTRTSPACTGSRWASGTASRRRLAGRPGATASRPTSERLRAAVRTVEITPLDYATRAHEILEDAQRDMLSGVDAPWSGAGLRGHRRLAGGDRSRDRHAAAAARRARRRAASRSKSSIAALRRPLRRRAPRPRRRLAARSKR